MFSKWSAFRKAQTQSQRFIRAFRKSTRLSELASVADQFKPSPLVAVFTEIHDEYFGRPPAAASRATPSPSNAPPRPPPAKPSPPWSSA